jgi:phenylpropionate dioxygenase-like ring-hydroxylating dioxygenase large terminal subunit
VTSTLDRPQPSERPAHGLPPEAYYDPEWYRREQRRLFARTWNLVGHTSDVAEPGDYLTADVGTEPVVVVRDADGGLRGFVNICRHRGMVIACDTGTCG